MKSIFKFLKMKKITFLFLLVLFSEPFALTLEQVKKALQENAIPQDSVEMNLRVTVKSTGVYQQTDIYTVSKGISKSYTEIKSNFLKQRSVVNGNKMKVVDLKTNKTQILDYNGEALQSLSYTHFNPLDSGDWQEPKFHSGDIFTIQGTFGTLYYNEKMKRIEKIEAVKERANTLTMFTYDANNKMKKMVVSVIVNGVESIVTTEFLRMRKSDKISDSLFEF